MNESETDQQRPTGSGRQYLVVFVGLFGQLILQFLLQKLLTGTLGAGLELDAYRFSLTLPLTAGAVMAGTIGPIILPVFSQSESKEASSIGGFVITIAFFSSLLVAIICFIFSQQVTSFLQAGNDPKTLMRTNEVFRVLIWLLPANVMIGILQSMLNAKLNFLPPVIAGIAGPLCTVLLFWYYSKQGNAEIIAWSTLSGAVVNLLIQFPAILKHVQFSGWKEVKPQLQKLLFLGLQLLLGMLIHNAIPLVDKYVLTSPTMPTGSITQYDLSYQFLNAFIMLASGTLSTVAFPRIARYAFQGGEQFSKEIALALRGLMLLVLPAMAVLFFFGEALIQEIFEAGEFLHKDTIIVGNLLRLFSFMILGAAIGELTTKTMYARQNTRTPLMISAIVISLSSIAKFWIVPLKGLESLAVITTLTYVTSATILLSLITRSVGPKIYRGLLPAIAISVFGTTLACAIGELMRSTSLPYPTVLGLIAGAGVYFLFIGLASKEVRDMLTLLCSGFFKKRVSTNKSSPL